jgi:hypothetical protein
MTAGEKVLYRILDANYNRSKEALRVVEDLLRFSSSPKALLEPWKQIRHSLTKIILLLPVNFKAMIACRDIEKDHGKTLGIRDKKGKLHLQDILFANIQRAEESLRVLEECVKPIKPECSDALMRLRFKVYELEKKIAQSI